MGTGYKINKNNTNLMTHLLMTTFTINGITDNPGIRITANPEFKTTCL